MWSPVLFFALVLLSHLLDESLGQIGDPCHLVHTYKSPESDLEYLGIPGANSSDLGIPAECLSGDVNWHRPQGYLVFYADRNNGGYYLCIEQTWGFNIGQLRDLTGEQDKVLPLPTLDKPSCVQDLYGEAKVLIKANDTAMISFDYKINYML